MNKEFIEQEVNKKLVALFYKLIALTPIKISNNSFYYKLNGEIFKVEISSLNGENFGYRYPEVHSTNSDWHILSHYFNSSNVWNFIITLPKTEVDTESYKQRQLEVPSFDEITLLDIKKKLLLVKQQYEFTLLDKYLKNSTDSEDDLLNYEASPII